jgi:hypothetical protein
MSDTIWRINIEKSCFFIVIDDYDLPMEQFAAQELKEVLIKNAKTNARVITKEDWDDWSIKPNCFSSMATYQSVIIFLLKAEKVIHKIQVENALKAPERDSERYQIETSLLKTSDGVGIYQIQIKGGSSAAVIYGVEDLARYFIEWPELLSDKAEIGIPAELRYSNSPIFTSRAAWTWDIHIVNNARQYIDRLARWKYNVLIIWNEPFLIQNPDLIEYAHSRGIRIISGIGINSYGTALSAPAYLKRSTETNWCLCPSEPENQRWMSEYLKNIIESLPSLDGIYFQTGNVDFALCKCVLCKDLTPLDAAVKQTVFAYEAVKSVSESIEVSIGFMNNESNREVVSRLPIGIKVIWEGEISPGTLQEARDASNLRSDADTGWLFRLYHAGGEPLVVLQEMKARVPGRMREWTVNALEKKVWNMTALLETVEWGEKDLYIPCIFSETLWQSSMDKDSWTKRLKLLRQNTRMKGLSEDSSSLQQITTAVSSGTLADTAWRAVKRPGNKNSRSFWIDSFRGNTAGDYIYAGETLLYTFWNPPRHVSVKVALELETGCGQELEKRYEPEGMSIKAWDTFFTNYPGHNPFKGVNHTLIQGNNSDHCNNPECDLTGTLEFPILINVNNVLKKSFRIKWPVVMQNQYTRRLDGAKRIRFEFDEVFYFGSQVDIQLTLPYNTDNWLILKEVTLECTEIIGHKIERFV